MSDQWGVTFRVVYDGMPLYAARLGAAVGLGIDKWAADLELAATANTPVLTGALRASRFRITDVVDEFDEAVNQMSSNNGRAEAIEKPIVTKHGAAVGFAASYAPYVEEGHHTRGGGFVAGRPFLYPELEKFKPRIAEYVRAELKKLEGDFPVHIGPGL